MFIVDGGKRRPLTVKEFGRVEEESEWFAALPDEAVQNFMESYLRLERSEGRAVNVLMGFLKEPEAWHGQRLPSAAQPGDCGLCGAHLDESGWAVDGISTGGITWSWMCIRCFFRLGCGLGKGWGQLYCKNEQDEWWLVKGLPPEEDSDFEVEI